jgi:flagellar biosynthesis protein FlhG
MEKSERPGEASRGETSLVGRRVVAFAGGRGGIGRSVLAANVGVYLAQIGKRVVVVDADLGGASLHTMLGMDRPPSSLSQMIDRQTDHLRKLILDTSIQNLQLLAGAGDRFGVANLRPTQKERLLQQLRTIEADFVLLDVGAGTSFNVLDLFLIADVGVMVVVPEPTAVEAFYRFLKSALIRLVRREVGRQTQWPSVLDDTVARLGGLPGPLQLRDALQGSSSWLAELVEATRLRLRPQLVVNRAKVRSDFDLGPSMRTMAARQLGIGIDYLGSIESDDAVWLAVRKRRPLMVEAAGTQAAKDIERIARRLLVAASPERASAVTPPPRPGDELNLYEVIEVDVGASEEDIRRGTRRMREIYRPDSLGGYSVLGAEQSQLTLERIQRVHDTLLDPKQRRAYDRMLNHDDAAEVPATGARREPESVEAPAARPAVPLDVELGPETEFTGELLRRVREAQGVDLRDVTGRTKIGATYLRAIEDEDFDALPALVYTRGFVGELAKYLKLDHQQVVKTYIKRFKKYLDETGKLD